MIHKRTRGVATMLISISLVLSFVAVVHAGRRNDADSVDTKTPIKHVVVIFQENVSFDHYFATYPHATQPNWPTGVSRPARHTHASTIAHRRLLDKKNPNSAQPFRLDLTQARDLRSGS